MSDRKAYIGDAVYVDVVDGQIVLTTEDGIKATNTIYLEPEVWVALCNYMHNFKEIMKAAR